MNNEFPNQQTYKVTACGRVPYTLGRPVGVDKLNELLKLHSVPCAIYSSGEWVGGYSPASGLVWA